MFDTLFVAASRSRVFFHEFPHSAFIYFCFFRASLFSPLRCHVRSNKSSGENIGGSNLFCKCHAAEPCYDPWKSAFDLMSDMVTWLWLHHGLAHSSCSLKHLTVLECVFVCAFLFSWIREHTCPVNKCDSAARFANVCEKTTEKMPFVGARVSSCLVVKQRMQYRRLPVTRTHDCSRFVNFFMSGSWDASPLCPSFHALWPWYVSFTTMERRATFNHTYCRLESPRYKYKHTHTHTHTHKNDHVYKLLRHAHAPIRTHEHTYHSRLKIMTHVVVFISVWSCSRLVSLCMEHLLRWV